LREVAKRRPLGGRGSPAAAHDGLECGRRSWRRGQAQAIAHLRHGLAHVQVRKRVVSVTEDRGKLIDIQKRVSVTFIAIPHDFPEQHAIRPDVAFRRNQAESAESIATKKYV
jgi:hypothetical protein